MIVTITLNAAIDKRYVTANAIAGEVNRVTECVYTPGGKGLNVSKVLSISGADVLASGFVGGFAGKYIESCLNDMGIPSDFYHVNGESRSCINIWDEVKKEQTEYLEPGFVLSEADVAGFMAKYKEQLKRADLISISGSVPKGVSSDIYKEIITAAKTAGKMVVLDSSGELLRQGLTAAPTLVKPNIDEIRMLTNKSCNDMDTLIDAATEIHQNGVLYVVISLGKDGSLLVCKEGVFQAINPKIDAVNTVGCGDSMVAGLAMGLIEGQDAAAILKKASAISAAAAMSLQTGFYEIAEMEKIYDKITVKKIR
jgi:tagatose 6-phosphate kinase